MMAPEPRQAALLTPALSPEPAPVEPAPIAASSPAAKPTQNQRALVDRWRPSSLDAIAGQPGAVKFLKTVAANPRPCAILLSGESGVGKTSAALALAADMRIDPDCSLWNLASGNQTVDDVRKMLDRMRGGTLANREKWSAWKMLLVNEADFMAPQCEAVWMDGLEHIPPHTIIIFTTNNPGKMSRRFRSRCQHLQFVSDAAALRAPAMALADRIWRQETGGAGPADRLESIVNSAIEAGALSFREMVQGLEMAISA
jgi:replication-associated recombination protein RarA